MASKGGIIVLENPLTSMTWLDEEMSAWVRSTAPYLAVAAACRYGADWRKYWLFCSNRPDILQLGLECDHAPDAHINFAGLRLPDGTFFSRLTACYPPDLADKLALIFSPFLSKRDVQIPLASWRTWLKPQFMAQPVLHRVEDGGGLVSTAVWHVPQSQDFFKMLRQRWTTQLFRTGLHHHILQHFATGSKESPLSHAQLLPFLEDIKYTFGIDDADWLRMLEVEPGQPFRLELWKTFLVAMQDPDVAFLSELKSGVRLGVNNVIPPSPLWPQQPSTISDDQDLVLCESSWKSALDQPDLVWPLLDEECAAGFIEKVPGGLSQLQREHEHVAVGKLGLVTAENRAPRLVVDSTVSGVTPNTCIPNRMLLPKILDVLKAAPQDASAVDMIAFTLDVSKAHRRIKIAPVDQGLLCFWFQDTLFKSKTLNFGARASGYFWARVAGLMVRTLHQVLHIRHSLFQYVDDILMLLEASTSPIWIGILTVTCIALCIPMSWHKTAWGPQVTWIGWTINVQRWVVSITPDKRAKILHQIQSLLRTTRCDFKMLESLIGRLLWVLTLWESLRPLLGPLYHALMAIPLTLVSISHDQWHELLHLVSEDLYLRKGMAHPSLRAHVRVARAANFDLRNLTHARTLSFKSCRIWLGIQFPGSGKRKLQADTHEALQAWEDILVGTPFFHNMLPSHVLDSVTASADACASTTQAGLGGILRLHGEVVAWFAFNIDYAEAQDIFPWLSDSMQKHINVWELLAQFALTYCLQQVLPGRTSPISVTLACDNTTAEAAHFKALSTSRGLCPILAAFFRFQRLHNIDVSIRHSWCLE